MSAQDRLLEPPSAVAEVDLQSSTNMTKASSESNTLDVQRSMLDEIRDLKELSMRLAAEPPLKYQTVWTSILQSIGLIAAILFGVFAIMAWKEARNANSLAISNNQSADQAYSLAARAYDAATQANSIAMAATSVGKRGVQLAATGIAEAQQANKLAVLRQCRQIVAAAAASTSSADTDVLNVCSSIQAVFERSVSDYAAEYYSFTYQPSDSATSNEPPPPSSATTTTTSSASSNPTLTDIPNTSASKSTAATTPTDGAGGPPASSGLSGGAKVGVIVGAIVGAVLLLCLAIGLPLLSYREKVRRQKLLTADLNEKFR